LVNILIKKIEIIRIESGYLSKAIMKAYNVVLRKIRGVVKSADAADVPGCL